MVTAAHCVTDGTATPSVNWLTARFKTESGTETYNGAAYYVPPTWTGNYMDGSDIAVVRLATRSSIHGYDIWRGSDPWDTIADVAGYGLSGNGATGVSGTYPFGTLRAGQNYLDPVEWGIDGSPYAWDFDDGTALHDALCIVTGVCQQGVGATEVLIAPGDSGGPMFFGGHLGGVHSFGATFGNAYGDIDNTLNSSFGELAGDTRVTAYADWIDSITVPEPGSMVLLGAGIGLLAFLRRRRA